MKVERKYTKDIYRMLEDWWLGNKFQVVSPSILPETTFVCYNDEDEPIYSMCFYNTDSNLCWVGWQLKNPNDVNREGGLEFLFKGVEKYAKAMGYHIIFTTSNTPPVENVLVSSDFKVGDTNVNHYLKILN